MDKILPGRRLLEASLPKGNTISIIYGGLVGGVAAVLILVFLFALCNNCKDSKKEQGKSGNPPKLINESHSDVVRSIIETDHLAVDFETGIVPLSNGIPSANSRTSDLAMFNSRPTSIDGSGLPNGRQLPSPPGPSNINPLPDVTMVDHPPNGLANGNRVSCHMPCNQDNEDNEDDPYDHLGQPNPSVVNSNNDNDDDDEDDAYDHVGSGSTIVKKSGCITITQADFNSYGSEQLYASVDGEEDNTYASLKISAKKRLPISSVVLPSEGTAFRDVSYSMVPADDLDDTYSKIPGEGDRAKCEVEDPYSSVDADRRSSGGGAVGLGIGAGGAATAGIGPANIAVPESVSPLCSSPVDNQLRNIEDDYATVNKPRRSPSNLAIQEHADVPDLLMAPPPEPPRAYKDEDLLNHEPPPEENVDGAVGVGVGQALLPEPAVQQPRVEPPYTKVTARESLSSINARQRLLNMYETVPETENTYATVDGGSGDGIVVRRPNRPETTPKRNSQVSETYAEIGATGGRPEAVPAPPSLDSLRTVTKQNPHGNDFRRSGGDFIQASTEIQHDYAVVNKRRTFPIDFSQAHYDVPISRNMPTLAMSAQRGLILINPTDSQPCVTSSLKPNSPNSNSTATASATPKPQEGATASTTASNITDSPSSPARNSTVMSTKADPDYQTVRDGTGSENDSEYDPNYETVEDAQRKAAAQRQSNARRRHYYEEVDASQLQNPSNSQPSAAASQPNAAAADARERVLRQHTYEDVREVRKQHNAMRRSREQ